MFLDDFWPFCLFSGFSNSKISACKDSQTKIFWRQLVHAYRSLTREQNFFRHLTRVSVRLSVTSIILAFFSFFWKSKIFGLGFSMGNRQTQKIFRLWTTKLFLSSQIFFYPKSSKIEFFIRFLRGEGNGLPPSPGKKSHLRHLFLRMKDNIKTKLQLTKEANHLDQYIFSFEECAIFINMIWTILCGKHTREMKVIAASPSWFWWTMTEWLFVLW